MWRLGLFEQPVPCGAAEPEGDRAAAISAMGQRLAAASVRYRDRLSSRQTETVGPVLTGTQSATPIEPGFGTPTRLLRDEQRQETLAMLGRACVLASAAVIGFAAVVYIERPGSVSAQPKTVSASRAAPQPAADPAPAPVTPSAAVSHQAALTPAQPHAPAMPPSSPAPRQTVASRAGMPDTGIAPAPAQATLAPTPASLRVAAEPSPPMVPADSAGDAEAAPASRHATAARPAPRPAPPVRAAARSVLPPLRHPLAVVAPRPMARPVAWRRPPPPHYDLPKWLTDRGPSQPARPLVMSPPPGYLTAPPAPAAQEPHYPPPETYPGQYWRG
jgi:hypothetical protein